MLVPGNNFGLGLFDEIFKDPFFSRTESKPVMKTDIKEKNDCYVMDIDLPGFRKEDVNAELKDGYITVTASRNESSEKKDEDGRYIHRERYSGSCSRTFYVGDGVTEEDIKASFSDGILQLTIPKEEPKRIEDTKRLIAIQ